MKFQLFQYPLPAPPDLADLNTYLGTNRVTSVSHHLVESTGGSMLLFLVQSVGSSVSNPKSEKRIDYRTVLNPEQFARVCQLRDERKAIAEEDNLPVYAVFTNAHLAELVQKEAKELNDLACIPGVVLNSFDFGVPWLGFVLYPNRIRSSFRGRKRLSRRWRQLERSRLAGRIEERELKVRSEALFAHAGHADDRAWRHTLLALRDQGEPPHSAPTQEQGEA